MEKWFMLHEKKHHHKMDDDLYIHFTETCSVFNMTDAKYTEYGMWGTRERSMSKAYFYPSKFGWVIIWYEKKGVLSLFVQISENRAAWQRIEWGVDFEMDYE